MWRKNLSTLDIASCHKLLTDWKKSIEGFKRSFERWKDPFFWFFISRLFNSTSIIVLLRKEGLVISQIRCLNNPVMLRISNYTMTTNLISPIVISASGLSTFYAMCNLNRKYDQFWLIKKKPFFASSSRIWIEAYWPILAQSWALFNCWIQEFDSLLP